MKLFGHFPFVIVIVAGLLTRCTVNRGVDHCSDSERKACSCSDKTKGSQACIDGVYEDCVCETDATYVDVGEEDDSNIEDTRDDSSANEDSGKGIAVADSGRTDTGLDAEGPLDAEESSDAEQSDAVSPDTGLDSEPTKTDKDSAQDSGEQDAETDAGSDSGNDAGSTTSVYGACEQGECSDDQQCTEVVDGTGTYCSIPCERTAQCPVPTSGTAVRRCSTTDGMCRLNCASGDCPEGMECFESGARATCVFPRPTEVYGICNGDECSGDQQCTVVFNGTGTYCSIPCDDTEQCPEPTSGTAVKQCSTVDGMCRLDCQSGDCPEGMECFEAVIRSTCVWE